MTFPTSNDREVVRLHLAAELATAQELGAPDSALERLVRTAADVFHRPYPQYVGHFDGYVAVRVTEPVRTKMGQAFEAGDFTIATKRDGEWTAYSWRNAVDTGLGRYTGVKVVAA